MKTSGTIKLKLSETLSINFVFVFVFVFVFIFVFVFVFDFGDPREEAAAHSSSATPDLRALSYCLWELGACVMDTGLFRNREWLIL